MNSSHDDELIFLKIFYLLFHINQLKFLYYYFHFSTAWIPNSKPVIFCPHNVLTKHFCLSLKSLGKASQFCFYRFDLMTYLVTWVMHINFLEFSNFNLSCQLLLSLWLFREIWIHVLSKLLIEISTSQVTMDQFMQAS